MSPSYCAATARSGSTKIMYKASPYGGHYAGTWVFGDDDILTVTGEDGRSISNQLGSLGPDWLARELLRKLARQAAWMEGIGTH